MTDKVKLLLNDLNSRNYRSARTPCDSISDSFEERISKDEPLLFENDDFGFNRSLAIKLGHGPGNVSPDYYSVLNKGFDLIIKNIETDDDELDAFLFSLGCYSGEPITVISHLKGGCIVSIKDGRYSIDKELAQAILI